MIMNRISFAFVVTILFASFTLLVINGAQFDWTGRDIFDEVFAKYGGMNGDVCNHKSRSDIVLDPTVLTMVPKANTLLDSTTTVFRNRTCLLALHDLALSRAYYFSYMFQKANETWTFWQQPGLMYYYIRQHSLISAFPHCINGSSLMFDFNISYPNWLTNLAVNTTIPFFGPKAYRVDNTYSAYNYLREPSLGAVYARDVGAGKVNNFTAKTWKSNLWYDLWLPDMRDISLEETVQKFQWQAAVKYSNKTGEWVNDEYSTTSFFGPPAPSLRDNVNLPVRFTQPYFDCGITDKWLVSAVSPVVDYLPRYLEWDHLRRHRFVAVATMDIDWDMIDFNPCPAGEGNPGPNLFAGIARCKPQTTMCQPLTGWGFARGSYECVCRPGYRYPHWQNGPFQGADIELATDKEYNAGFECLKIDNMKVVPSIQYTNNEEDIVPIFDQNGRRKTRDLNAKNNVSNNVADLKQIKKSFKRVELKSISNKPGKAKDSVKSLQKHQLVEEAMAKIHNGNVVIQSRRMHRNHKQSKTNHREIASSVFIGPKHKDNFEEQLNSKKVHVSIKPKNAMKVTHKPLVTEEKLRKVYGPNYRKRIEAIQAAKMNQRKMENNQRLWHKTDKDDKTFKRKKRQVIDGSAISRMEQIFQHMDTVTAAPDCTKLPKGDLKLPGDVAYGANVQFEYQARTALALAYFLSGFYQNVIVNQNYGLIKGDTLLNVDQLHAEVISHVMSDHKIRGIGIWFDEDQFKDPTGKSRRIFAPYAFQQEDLYRSVDYAGDPNIGSYLSTTWFRKVKMRWVSNGSGLKKFIYFPSFRADWNGTAETKFPYPVVYKAPLYQHGQWTPPYFPCTSYVNDWVITYAVPFFGKHPLRSDIAKFMGVVTVDIKLSYLDINQCSAEFWVANAFKDTARCDYETTYCTPVEGKRFQRGAYRCNCKQGFEYPFLENAYFFDGAVMETEWSKKQRGEFHKYDVLQCRPAGASRLTDISVVVSVLFAVFKFLA